MNGGEQAERVERALAEQLGGHASSTLQLQLQSMSDSLFLYWHSDHLVADREGLADQPLDAGLKHPDSAGLGDHPREVLLDALDHVPIRAAFAECSRRKRKGRPTTGSLGEA